jgi:hypothetical protein
MNMSLDMGDELLLVVGSAVSEAAAAVAVLAAVTDRAGVVEVSTAQ